MKNMKSRIMNMTVKSKLITTFTIVLILSALCICGSIVSLISAKQHLQELNKLSIPIIDQTWLIRRNVSDIEATLIEMVLIGDANSNSQRMGHLIETNQKDSEELFKAVQFLEENLLKINLKSDVINNAKYFLEEAKKIRVEKLEPAVIKNNKLSEEILRNELIPAFSKVRDELKDLTDNINKNIDIKISQNEKTANISVIVIVILFAFTAILCGYLISRIIKEITNPLWQIDSSMKELAKGNLKFSISYESEDEFGQVCKNLKNVQEELSKYIHEIDSILNEFANGNFAYEWKTVFLGEFINIESSLKRFSSHICSTLGDINKSSERVASASENISEASNDIAQGATEQATSIEQLTANIDEIYNKVSENAQSANEANINAEDAKMCLIESSEYMKDMMIAIDEIDKSSSKINDMLKCIDDIASQTNLLSLNAAIEAARAGQSGKGFAVVASEIRELANKTSESARTSSELIDNSIKAVKQGLDMAHKTMDSLETLKGKATKVTTKVELIAQSSSEQERSIKEILLGADEISSVVQTNSSVSEEVAAASEELSNQAKSLKGLVSQFVLKNNNL